MYRITKQELDHIQNLPDTTGKYMDDDGNRCALGKLSLLTPIDNVRPQASLSSPFLPVIEVPIFQAANKVRMRSKMRHNQILMRLFGDPATINSIWKMNDMGVIPFSLKRIIGQKARHDIAFTLAINHMERLGKIEIIKDTPELRVPMVVKTTKAEEFHYA
jgi:hypothetical protein